MQCLQLTRGDPPATPLKWYFNQTITLPEKGTEWRINFTLRAEIAEFHKINVVLNTNDVLTLYGYYYEYIGMQITINRELYNDKSGWVKSGYRTITFATPPAGDLLAWLKDNATPK